MMLEDVRDYINSLGIADHVYMGKLPDKEDKSIGVYNSKHQHTYRATLGGSSTEGYGEKYVTTVRLPRRIRIFGEICLSKKQSSQKHWRTLQNR